MKQYITEKQALDLSKEGWRKLLKHKMRSLEISGGLGIWWPITIGEMIEFLDENEYRKIWDMQRKDHSGIDHYWLVGVNEGLYENDELCDALWEAVKSTLQGGE